MSNSSAAPNAAPSVSPGVAAVLARFDRSSPDNLLTSLATEILRLTRAQADLAARLQAVEQLQAVADRLLPEAGGAEPAELPKTALIDATQAILDGAGFYPLEFDGAGNPIRWTGPSAQFSLSLFIDRRQGGRFKLHFTRFAASVSASFMRCLLDGKPADITVHDLRGSFELSGVLPPRADPGASVLTFICPATASQAQLGQGSDQRQMGLCFQKLTAQSAMAADTAPQSASPPAGAEPRPLADGPSAVRRVKRAE